MFFSRPDNPQICPFPVPQAHLNQPQMASRSVQSFLQGSRTWQTDRQTDQATQSVATARILCTECVRCGLKIASVKSELGRVKRTKRSAVREWKDAETFGEQVNWELDMDVTVHSTSPIITSTSAAVRTKSRWRPWTTRAQQTIAVKNFRYATFHH